MAIHLLNGISFGMILFLLSMGFSLTLGLMGILNLTHGAMFMVGGFIGYTVVGAGGNFLVAVLSGSIAAGLIGLVIERLFLRRIYNRLDDQVLLTLGLVYIFENVILWIYGGHGRMTNPPPFMAFTVDIGGRSFPGYRLGVIAVGLIAFIGLWWLIDRTRIGAIVRAGMDDNEMTRGLGINHELIYGAVFALGAFAGGFSGAIGTPMMSFIFSMPMEVLLYALIVVVVGGPGSVLGTLIGALVIGMIDALGKAFIPDLASFTIYIVLIIMLLFRPTGLMGRTMA
ncbi:MAG: branched-chain amino acid ABC transporter permease [Deltaproteobacteria bacterium]|nr:branched-chain amino acid ABC transporter permease [Deltaproteobacteria bacterium]